MSCQKRAVLEIFGGQTSINPVLYGTTISEDIGKTELVECHFFHVGWLVLGKLEGLKKGLDFKCFRK